MDSALLALYAPFAGALAYLVRSHCTQMARLVDAIIATQATSTASLSSIATSLAQLEARPCPRSNAHD